MGQYERDAAAWQQAQNATAAMHAMERQMAWRVPPLRDRIRAALRVLLYGDAVAVVTACECRDCCHTPS